MWLIIFIGITIIVCAFLQVKHNEKFRANGAGKPSTVPFNSTLSTSKRSRSKYTSTDYKPNFSLINIEYFFQDNRGFIPDIVYGELELHMLNGLENIYIDSNILHSIQEKKQIRNEADFLLMKTASLNNKGIALEKEGKIEEAISVYEENIALGYNAHHAYKRLMVLYKKSKDVDNEIRVINRALDVFGEYPEYTERLKKAIELQHNTKQTS